MRNNNLAKRAAKIKILLMDVDGVLTDGKMYLLPGTDGKTVELKGFNALDGIGLRLLRNFGIETGIITGRKSASTRERARMLAMKYVYQGFLSKLAPFEAILSKSGFSPDETAYIGDDLTDIPVMKKAGLACAPANAVLEAKRAAHFVSKRAGGDGAVREVCDLILKSRGKWKEVESRVETAQWDPLPRQKILIIDGHH